MNSTKVLGYWGVFIGFINVALIHGWAEIEPVPPVDGLLRFPKIDGKLLLILL